MTVAGQLATFNGCTGGSVGQGEHCANGGLYVFLRPRRRWKDDIKTDLQEVIWGGADCIDLGQDMDG